MSVPHALFVRLCVCIFLFGTFFSGLEPLLGPAPLDGWGIPSGPISAEYRVAVAGEKPVAVVPQALRPPLPSADGWVEKTWSGLVVAAGEKTRRHASERLRGFQRHLRNLELRI